MKADLFFTTPSVIIQPLSGLALMAVAGFPMQFAPMNWLGLSLLLYIVAGAARPNLRSRPPTGGTSVLGRSWAYLLSTAWWWSSG